MFVIPSDRLPPGFAERIETPPAEPAVPRPAATAVLLRDGRSGPETLLLRRNRSAGFVPGAYVFPGGRVDAADGDRSVLERVDGLPPAAIPENAGGAAYWIAAAREVFEETGVLLATDPEGRPAPGAAADPKLEGWRERLLDGSATLLDLLDSMRLRLDLRDVVYFAHWITPVAEPRRYDTRFFLAALPPGLEAKPDPREMSDAVWLSPEAGLERFERGRLSMVFPTVRTLESLRGFGSVAEALDAFRGRPVRPILPRLVRTETGVAIVLDPD